MKLEEVNRAALRNTYCLLKVLVLACLTLVLLCSSAWCAAKEPGGKGQLKSTLGLKNCFHPESATIKEVCAQYTINWKMWSLLGEPVGDYNVAWKLTGIKLMDPQRKLISSFTPGNLPNELKKPAKAIELYLDAVAAVNASTGYTFHHFNTGTAVRAGAGSSLNVPGSPSWDKLFLTSRPGSCDGDDKHAIYLDAKTAKTVFKAGIHLSDLEICPKSGVSELASLESAIAKMCEKPGADKKYEFCPNQTEAKKDVTKADPTSKHKDASRDKVNNKELPQTAPGLGASALDGGSSDSRNDIQGLLDESASRPAIQKRLAHEIANYRRTAEPACRNAMKAIDACYAKTGCSRPAESPTVDQCNSIPAYPQGAIRALTLTRMPSEGEVCYREDAECIAARAQWEAERREEDRRGAEALERRQSQWRSNYDSLSKKCQRRTKERAAFASCQKQYDATCNPKNFSTVDDCVNERVKRKGPTENDAQKLMQEEWDRRSKTGISITNSILD